MKAIYFRSNHCVDFIILGVYVCDPSDVYKNIGSCIVYTILLKLLFVRSVTIGS